MDLDVVVREDTPLPEGTCWAEWTPEVLCPHRAVWELTNLDSGGTTRLCTLHRAAWTAAHLLASVVVVALADEVPP